MPVSRPPLSPSYSLNAPTWYVFLISVLEWSPSLTHLPPLPSPPLPAYTLVRSKLAREDLVFPLGKGKEGRGRELSREIRYSQFRPADCHRNREGKGSLRLFSPYAFHLHFPLRLFSLLAVSSLLASFQLFLFFFSLSFFFSSFLSSPLSSSSYFFLSPSFLLPRIDRKRTRFRLLASNFLAFTTPPKEGYCFFESTLRTSIRFN